MRIERQHGYAGLLHAEIAFQRLVQHIQFAQDAFFCNLRGDIGDGHMVAHQRHTQPFRT